MDKILFPQLVEFFGGFGPALGVIAAVIVLLIIKDWSASIAKGLKFYRNPAFMPGDRVLLDGEIATIISIGFTETIFQIEREEYKSWRYVPNTRIDYLKLEKVIE